MPTDVGRIPRARAPEKYYTDSCRYIVHVYTYTRAAITVLEQYRDSTLSYGSKEGNSRSVDILL
jgi:hypothetical protein